MRELVYNFFFSDLCSLLKEYISSLDLICLLNCCKGFQSIRKHVLYFTLNHTDAWKYILDSTFFDVINSKVIYPQRQIKLSIADDYNGYHSKLLCPLTLAPLVLSIHALKLVVYVDSSDSKQISLIDIDCNFPHLSNLEVEGGEVPSYFEGFPHLQCLKISPSNVDPIELSIFSRLQEVAIYDTSLTDVSALADVKRLTLNNIFELTDVRPLCYVYDLTLICCFQLEDITCLTNNHKIYISNCDRIASFNAFKDTKDVHLSLVQPPTDLDKIPRIHTVDMTEKAFLSLKTVSNIYHLGIYGSFKQGIDFSSLGNVPKLCISVHSGAESPISLVGLGKGTKALSLTTTSPRFTDFFALRCIKKVTLSGVGEISSSDLSHVEELVLNECQLKDCCHFNKLKSITLMSCKIEDFSGFERISSVEFHLLRNLSRPYRYFIPDVWGNEKISFQIPFLPTLEEVFDSIDVRTEVEGLKTYLTSMPSLQGNYTLDESRYHWIYLKNY